MIWLLISSSYHHLPHKVKTRSNNSNNNNDELIAHHPSADVSQEKIDGQPEVSASRRRRDRANRGATERARSKSRLGTPSGNPAYTFPPCTHRCAQ